MTRWRRAGRGAIVAGIAALLAGSPAGPGRGDDGGQTPAYRWTQVTDAAAFPPRDGAGALVYEGAMWLIGGWNPADTATNPNIAGTNNEVWRSVDGADWEKIKPNTHLDESFDPASDWEARHTAGYAVHDGKMWIVGGDSNLGHYQSDVWNSTDGRTWTRVTATAAWGPRILHSTVAHAGKLWVIGGQAVSKRVQKDVWQFKGPSEERFYNDVWNSTDGVHWTRVTEHAPWAARGLIGGAAVKDGRIWIIGGGTYSTDCRNDVWSSADGVDWTCHTPQAAWPPRQYHDVAVFDGRLWVMEGVVNAGTPQGRNGKDVWHSADGAHWTEVPDTPWKQRHAASVFVHQDALWMVAGNHMGRDVWKLERVDEAVATAAACILQVADTLGPGEAADLVRARVARARSIEMLEAAAAGLVTLRVHVNPESRVKLQAVRPVGELVVGRPRPLLVEVVNEAGVTAALELHVRDLSEGAAGPVEFCTVALRADDVSRPQLSGAKLEWKLADLELKAVGRREVRLEADVGQGTQDLGFRSTADLLLRGVDAGNDAGRP